MGFHLHHPTMDQSSSASVAAVPVMPDNLLKSLKRHW
jgi:hypothetical protein